MNVSAAASALRPAVRGRLEQDVSLASFTTYRLGGPARLFFEPADAGDLENLARTLRDLRRIPGELPVLALGRGSNIVVSDEGWPGLVIRPGAAFSWIEGASDVPEAVAAGAATPLPVLANWAARRGLKGLEFLVAIPGSVGGAVRMNAGAHGRDIQDCLDSARIFDVDDLSMRVGDAADLDLSYRLSNLGDTDLVIDARFWLAKDDPTAIRERMDAYRRHRADTQPGALQNAGSVFKNPPGDAAGRLVDAAGLKGFSVGGASVSELHANFFIASDGARSQDVYDLVFEVRRRVRDACGIDLEPEIRFAGAFKSRSAQKSA